MKMGKIIQTALMAGAFVCLPAIQARERTDNYMQNPLVVKGQDTNIMVAGMLEKTGTPHEYMLRGDDGRIYNLTSNDVHMRKDVGQRVLVTGCVMKHATRVDERKENKPVTHLDVTQIQPLN